MIKRRFYNLDRLNISSNLSLILLENVVLKSHDIHSTIISSRNLESIRSSFMSNSELTSESHNLWYKKYLQTDNDSMFCIYYEGNFVGQIGLYNYQVHDHSVELGRLYVLPQYQRLGIMYNAITALLADIQSKRAFSLIYLVCKPDNLPAIILYNKLGFEIKGSPCNGVQRMEKLL